jgi:hypothetical protein
MNSPIKAAQHFSSTNPFCCLSALAVARASPALTRMQTLGTIRQLARDPQVDPVDRVDAQLAKLAPRKRKTSVVTRKAAAHEAATDSSRPHSGGGHGTSVPRKLQLRRNVALLKNQKSLCFLSLCPSNNMQIEYISVILEELRYQRTGE